MVQFQEDGNFMEMAVSKSVQRKEFPSPSDDEEESGSETEEGELIDELLNNNATIEQSGGQPLLGVVGSRGATATSARSQPAFHNEGPSTSEGGVNNPFVLKQTPPSNIGHTLAIMQNFMVKKGLIDSSMTEEEIQQFIEEDVARTLSHMNQPV